jgi:hypothetical protein
MAKSTLPTQAPYGGRAVEDDVQEVEDVPANDASRLTLVMKHELNVHLIEDGTHRLTSSLNRA